MDTPRIGLSSFFLIFSSSLKTPASPIKNATSTLNKV